MPICSSGSCEDEDSTECTGSSVILTKGAYETSDTDLTLALKGMPLTLERTYRSNTIVPKPNFSIYWWKFPAYDKVVEVPVFYGYRKADPIHVKIIPPPEPSVPSEEPPEPVAPAPADDSTEPPKFEVPLDGPLGYGWQSELFAAIRGGGLAYYDGQGRFTEFQKFAFTADLDNLNIGGNTGYSNDINGISDTDAESGLTLNGTEYGYELIERGGLKRQFDRNGKLRVIEDASGNFLNIRYDDHYRISSVEDSTETTVLTFNYIDDDNHIDSMTDLYGRTVTYEYDEFGHLTDVTRTDEQGREYHKTYTYNSYHGLLTKTNEVGETYTVTYAYPDRGIVESVIDPIGTASLNQGGNAEGHQRGFLYDFNNRQFWISTPEGHVINKSFGVTGRLLAEYEIDAENRLIQKIEYIDSSEEIHTDGAGNVRHVYRDEWRNVTKTVDGEGNEVRISYNNHNKPLQITDTNGVITRIAYDDTGLLPIKKTEGVGLAEQVITEYAYNDAGKLISTTIDGATTSIEYGDQGLPTAIIDPLGNTSRIEYDQYGGISATVDANGNRTEIKNDFRGNPIEITDPLNNVTVLEYNAAGRLKTVVDALLNVTSLESDYKGHITAKVDALNQRTEYDYDGDENLRRITRIAPGDDRSLDAVIQMEYDGSARLTSVTDAEGNTISYTYAKEGCSTCGGSGELPETITDPFGQVTTQMFDKNGELVGVRTPLDQLNSTASMVERDPSGLITKRTDANGKETLYQYDALGRVLNQLDAAGGLTEFAYDKHGNLTTLTDPEGNKTTFEYDLAGRKIKETRPMGQILRYSYYPNGLLKTLTDAKGQVTTYSYDGGGRLVSVTYHDGLEDHFGYDAVANLTSWSNESASGTFDYDELGRKQQETINYGSFSKGYSYSYDFRGNKASYTDPEGITHRYQYRKNDQLSAIQFDSQTVSLTYDKTRLQQLSYPSGVVTNYGYNVAGWLETLQTSKDGTALLQRDYQFDHVGNIDQVTSLQGQTAYGYDDNYQLTSADFPAGSGLAAESYSYDQVGNRLTTSSSATSWSYNQNNELLAAEAASYDYDANGNTVRKTVGAQITRYEYNSRNRLSRIYLPDGRVADYTYDPFGRRIKKQVASSTIWYLYADEGLVGEYSASGYWLKSYGWKPNGMWGTDPLYMRDGTGLYFYHNDHLGTPQRLSNATTGAIVWSAGYAAFGKGTVDPLSTVENNLRLPGQYFDEESGLHYNWQRTYDPETGRYTQVDPIGFYAGDVNLYRYVGNRIVNLMDSLGLKVDWEKFVKYTDTIEKHVTKYGKNLEKIEQFIVKKTVGYFVQVTPKALNVVGKVGSGILGAIFWVFTTPTTLADPMLDKDGKVYNPDGSEFKSELNNLSIIPINDKNFCKK